MAERDRFELDLAAALRDYAGGGTDGGPPDRAGPALRDGVSPPASGVRPMAPADRLAPRLGAAPAGGTARRAARRNAARRLSSRGALAASRGALAAPPGRARPDGGRQAPTGGGGRAVRWGRGRPERGGLGRTSDALGRLDPVSGAVRTWTFADDAAFGSIGSIVSARGGGAWLLPPANGVDQALRLFDGERYRDVVPRLRAAPSAHSPRRPTGRCGRAGSPACSTGTGRPGRAPRRGDRRPAYQRSRWTGAEPSGSATASSTNGAAARNTGSRASTAHAGKRSRTCPAGAGSARPPTAPSGSPAAGTFPLRWARVDAAGRRLAARWGGSHVGSRRDPLGDEVRLLPGRGPDRALRRQRMGRVHRGGWVAGSTNCGQVVFTAHGVYVGTGDGLYRLVGERWERAPGRRRRRRSRPGTLALYITR